MAFDVPDPLAALRLWLLADADVIAFTGTAIYTMEIPKEVAGDMPKYLLLLKETSGGIPPMGCARLGAFPIDVRSYGPSYGAARVLAMGVYQKLKFLQRATANNTLIHNVVPLSGRMNVRDPNTDSPFVNQSFKLTAAETAITP